MSVYINLYILK